MYGCGVLVCYASRAPTGVGVDGAGGKFEYQAADGCLKVGRRRFTPCALRFASATEAETSSSVFFSSSYSRPRPPRPRPPVLLLLLPLPLLLLLFLCDGPLSKIASNLNLRRYVQVHMGTAEGVHEVRVAF